MPSAIKTKLAEAFRASGLSRVELEALTGLSHTTIDNLLSIRDSNLTLASVEAIAKALGVELFVSNPYKSLGTQTCRYSCNKPNGVELRYNMALTLKKDTIAYPKDLWLSTGELPSDTFIQLIAGAKVEYLGHTPGGMLIVRCYSEHNTEMNNQLIIHPQALVELKG